MASYSDAKRKAIRRAYVVDNKTVALIADEYGIPSRTIFNWKKAALAEGDDWDKERAIVAMGGGGEEQLVTVLVPMLMRFAKSIMDGVEAQPDMPVLQRAELLAKLSDSLTKTTSALRRLNPGIDKLAMGVEFIGLLTKFVTTRFPQHAAAMEEILEPFGRELLAHLDS